jgi:hypothetical protein
MNLDAFATLCRIAQANGTDLWHYRTAAGVGVVTAFDYLIPYVLQPATWKKDQINRYNPGGYYFPGLAGKYLPSPNLLAAYEKLPRSESPWIQLVDMLVRA